MPAPDYERLSFMVVDDSDHMRRLVRVILQAFGARAIQEASEGSEALDLMTGTTGPDILITNWNMMPLDGVELTRHIRNGEDTPNPYMPIIMITGFADRRRVLMARDAGITEYLIKPFSAKALHARIGAVVMRPRPFVRTRSFFGPDRRRHAGDYQGQEKRKAAAPPPDTVMTQQEINRLVAGDDE